ncbi:MAG TPA: ferrochelatase [Candidatus Dormibacteraeota bacterium]|nr:ferrochelatase [Candidatus Dormibacteraeota bacterium]
MSAAATEAPAGVLLLTFGSAVTSADVPAYLRSVRGGSEPSAELVTEFQRRFDVIGRSPLIDITTEQAAALERTLADRHPARGLRVAAGMLHSRPRIADSLRTFVDGGVRRVLAIVLAPQYSPLILSGYERAVSAAVDEAGPAVTVRIAGAWHLTPSWIGSLSARVDESLREAKVAAGDRLAVVFTAHSLPRAVVERDPGYMVQIDETIAAVARRVGLDAGHWTFAFQSAGHTPEEWLRPDLTEVLSGLSDSGATEVLVVPVQFVSDHLETLYDIDVAAAEQARAVGLRFHRIAMPNADELFIAALAEVVEREMAAVHA